MVSRTGHHRPSRANRPTAPRPVAADDRQYRASPTISGTRIAAPRSPRSRARV